jgi:hypothetical protein
VKTRLALTSVVVALAVPLGVDASPASAAASSCPDPNPPNELVLAGGSGQTAQLGNPFASPLQVKLANTNGCPLTGDLAGVNVDFVAPAGGASGTFASSGSSSAVVGTDAQGVATAPAFTADDTAGAYTVHAESDYGTVRLYLANTASGLAASITAIGAASRQATVNGRYQQPLQVRVTDADGRAVQGVTVGFALQSGPYGAGATFLTGGAQVTETTDGDGVATSPLFTANGSPGRFTATASTGRLASVASFGLDNHAAADTLSAASPTIQRATIAGRYARPLAARLLDPDGQPIEGAGVTFTLGSTAASGAGSAAAGASFLGGAGQATVLTDADGEAASPPILANATAGDFTATATVAGITAPLTYALRNLPARLVAADPPGNATVERRYRRSLRVRVRGADGKPLDGVAVTFTIGTSPGGAGATFPGGAGQATATTNSAGIATAPAVTANSTSGSFEATATLAGSTPVRYTLRNRAGKPQTIATGAADGTSTSVGARLPIRLAVTVTDENGNPVPGALVRFTAPDHGPGGHFAIRAHATHSAGRTARVRTNAKGIAIAPPFTANHIAGGYAVGARTGSRQAAFALVNRP